MRHVANGQDAIERLLTFDIHINDAERAIAYVEAVNIRSGDGQRYRQHRAHTTQETGN